MISAWVGAPKNWSGDKLFNTRKLKFRERLNSNFFGFPLLNNLFISFLNSFIFFFELKLLLNSLLIFYFNLFYFFN